MKRLVDLEHIDHIITELFYIRAMSDDERVNNRLSELLHFVEEFLLDPDRDIRNEIKRNVYQKIKQAKDQTEAGAWHEVYQNINKAFSRRKE